MTKAPELSSKLLKLRLILWQLPVERLEEIEEVLRLNTNCTQKLERTSFDTHHELAFHRGTLSDDSVPRKQ